MYAVAATWMLLPKESIIESGTTLQARRLLGFFRCQRTEPSNWDKRHCWFFNISCTLGRRQKSAIRTGVQRPRPRPQQVPLIIDTERWQIVRFVCGRLRIILIFCHWRKNWNMTHKSPRVLMYKQATGRTYECNEPAHTSYICRWIIKQMYYSYALERKCSMRTSWIS